MSDEFFADVPDDAQLDRWQVELLRGLRKALGERRPRFVEAAATQATWHDPYLSLRIPHAAEPATEINVQYGDGYMHVVWPFRDFVGWETPDRLVPLLAGALDGTTRELLRLRAGRVTSRELELAVADRPAERVVRERELRTAPLLLVPGLPNSCVHRSLSFDRTPALQPEP